MKKVLLLFLAAILTLSLVLTGCGSKQEEQQPDQPNETEDKSAASEGVKLDDIKAGFIYIGPVGDGGWTYAHNEGRLMLEEQTGIETVINESVPEGPEAEKVMKDMIDQGCNVIFATSFGYMDYMEKVAKEYPDVVFFHCSGYKMSDNMSNYFGRMYQARYLSGIVAGMKTKANEIGYVAAFPIPEVIRGINSFTLGVQSVNPDAKVKVRWTSTWYDPATEKEAAKALLDEGVDIIAQHQDTPGPQQAAEEKGVWSIGYDTPMAKFAPEAVMTSPVWNWGTYYVDEIKKLQEGTWEASSYWGGLNDGIIELTELTEVAPEGAQEKVNDMEAKIKDGSFVVFQGPILDQEGNEKVSEGESLDDAAMLSMDWFVKGVEGKIE